MVKTGILWRDSTPEQLQADQWEIPPFHTIPVPGEAMREASSVGDAHIWYAIGDCWAQIVSHHLPWGSSQVLDIGCSCGKVARFLAYDPRVSFLGLDVFAPSIEWCRRAFANVPRFRFEHLDVHSLLYNPDGQIAGADVRLPVDDRSVDVVIAGSLFTHLLEDAFKNYLSEIARVLKPSGCGIISIHLRANNPAGFMGDEVQAEVTPDHSHTWLTMPGCEPRNGVRCSARPSWCCGLRETEGTAFALARLRKLERHALLWLDVADVS